MQTSAFVRRAAGGLGLGLITAGLAALPSTAQANPAGTALVINEVYGGGGNNGADLNADYVELYNPTAAAISLSGLSIQYRSATGSAATNGTAALTGSVPAGKTFLIQTSTAGSNGSAIPAPDVTVTGVNMGASAGQVFLVDGTTSITPSPATGNMTSDSRIVDMVGVGPTSTSFETAPAPAMSTTTSVSRTAGVDTNNNSADFTAGDQTPTASGGGVVEPPPEPVEVTIAEIQGTGAASPLADDPVVTEGVVTAAFPTGGYNGFYIQTGGDDTTPGASDGVFVYEPGFADTIEVGDSVEVEGVVKEFSSLTEIDATEVTELSQPLPPAVPNTVLPGTDCALPGDECLTGAELDAAREEFEGEAFQPTTPMTVTDSYDFGVTSSSFFGEIGIAAASDIPLVTPTEVIDAQDADAIAARTAYNTAHLVILDDGSSANYWNTSNTAGAQDQPVPWLTEDHTVRVGADVTFDEPVVLDYRFGWKLQPQRQVVGEPTGLVTFEQDRPATPAAVGGDLKLATFNVLNYFTTFGGDVPGCTAFVDRQQAKIVNAINTMDADIVSLEELENSKSVDGANRDEALAALVAALNEDAGAQRWSFVPSPAVVPASEDVIRNAFIYDPATVATVGESEIHDVSAFDNARDPLAQLFKPKAGTSGDRQPLQVQGLRRGRRHRPGQCQPRPRGAGHGPDRVRQQLRRRSRHRQGLPHR
jgi:5'-nucleotidase